MTVQRPWENPEIPQAPKNNFNEAEVKKANVFYCPGGFDYD